jgi:hypothetical protein
VHFTRVDGEVYAAEDFLVADRCVEVLYFKHFFVF